MLLKPFKFRGTSVEKPSCRQILLENAIKGRDENNLIDHFQHMAASTPTKTYSDDEKIVRFSFSHLFTSEVSFRGRP